MIRLLEWDTAFFGFKIGAVDVSSLSEVAVCELERFDLVYIFAQKKETKISYDLFLADEKRTYLKKIQEPLMLMDKNIFSVVPSEIADVKLLDLTYQAGAYSRFKLDNGFPEGSFKKLYKSWINKSVSRNIAKEVLVYKTKDYECAGLITLGLKNDKPDIGIIAVDKAVRGIGIGSKLIHAAEWWALNKQQINEIQVVTQGANIHACKFYERQGYSLKTKLFIYHWWSPKFKK